MTTKFEDRLTLAPDNKSATVDFDDGVLHLRMAPKKTKSKIMKHDLEVSVDGYDWYQASSNMKNSALPPLEHALNQVRDFASSAQEGFGIVVRGCS